MPSQRFSKLEKSILWNHRKEFSGHYHLMTRCMSSITENYDIKNVDKMIKGIDNPSTPRENLKLSLLNHEKVFTN